MKTGMAEKMQLPKSTPKDFEFQFIRVPYFVFMFVSSLNNMIFIQGCFSMVDRSMT